jgi:hypothetical protein
MKIWLLLAIAGLLLVWSLSREGFEATPTIKAPPHYPEEKIRIVGMLNNDERTLIQQNLEHISPDKSVQEIRLLVADRLSQVVGDAYTALYKPATTPITDEQIKEYVEGQGNNISLDLRPMFKRLLRTYFIDQQSGSTTGGTRPTGGPPPDMGPPPPTTQGTTAGGTTGGSSTSSAAPNAGPVGSSGKGKSIYGPVYTSLGTPVSGGGGKDSSTTNQYPELLGGVGDVTSVRTPSGIQDPSKSWQLSQSGALPSTASLGSDPNAAYFPNSRSPGDQDLIPDPYRLSRNYSTASYSNKTDPVPFLTDFSAFFK